MSLPKVILYTEYNTQSIIHRVKLFSDVFTKYSETNKNVLMSSLFINEKRGMRGVKQNVCYEVLSSA